MSKFSEIEEEESVPSVDDMPYEVICDAIRCHIDMLGAVSLVNSNASFPNEKEYVSVLTKSEQARIKKSMMIWFNYLELELLK